MMPQFHAVSCRFDKQNIAVGLTLLCFGLFKKVVFADHIAVYVTPIYEHSTTEGGTSFLRAWIAAIGFTLQIYFDFSGYSDMALGSARVFGIKLPQNFNSPLRASSIIDFWLRWHMTLTRFLTGYCYNPLVLWLTRRRLAKAQSGFSGRNTTVGAFVYLLMFPTLLTMFISGLWHGAGYGFLVWGLLHGVYLTINHGWRLVAGRLWRDRRSYARVMEPAGFVLTFLSVVSAMVFFRAATMASAIDVVKGMIGLNGIGVPEAVLDHLGPLTERLRGVGVVAESWSLQDFAKTAIWIFVLMVVAFGCPNVLQILTRYEPALGVAALSGKPGTGFSPLAWNASLPWAIVVSVVAATAIVSMGGPSEFLYWQF